MTYPILEFDPSPEAFIEPSEIKRVHDLPEYCVICFFREVLDKVIAERDAKIAVKNWWEDGQHNIYEITYQNRRLAFFHPGVGAPMAAGLLEEAIAFGCRKFIACGGCGVLEKEIAVGHLIVVSGAVRDEVVSYHYLPPGREVTANEAGVNALVNTLNACGLPYLVGKTWTTDAPDSRAHRDFDSSLLHAPDAARRPRPGFSGADGLSGRNREHPPATRFGPADLRAIPVVHEPPGLS